MLLLLLICTVCVCFILPSTSATEVKWTGNEADQAEGNSGPLPLSQQQRQQLLQLEDVIRQSPDPQATLQKAADANNMSAQDLMNMLQRNRSDMEQQGTAVGRGGGSGGMSSTVGGNLAKLVTALFAVLTKSAQHNPRAFAIMATACLLVLFVAISAPRTGLVLSNQRSFLSRGPTTVLKPPTKFLEKRMASARWQQRDVKSSTMSSDIWNDLALEEDGTIWHSLSRKSELTKAASAQITIPIASFMEVGADNENEEEDEEDVMDYIMDICYNHAVDVLSARHFTEYVPNDSILMHTLQKDEGRKRFAVLVAKKLGDLGRYGLVPLQVTQKQEGESETSLTYSTLKGAPFTGQIHISAVQKRPSIKKGGSADNMSVVLQVHLAIPRKGNKISRKMGVQIADSLATSIAASVRTRTRQSLARRSQSSTFKGKAKARAEERRSVRFKKEKDMEEMSEERRRRWQRKNPNAGSYRPSGDMMKSPGGGPAFR